MQLSRVERWMLSNQLRILEALYPDEAKSLAEQRVSLERGYELHHQWHCDHIYPDDQVMTAEQCREVLDILTMFSAIKHSYKKLTKKPDIEKRKMAFRGFDGNSETQEMAYAEYFCETDGGKYKDLQIKDFNAHMPMLDTYRSMLEAWKSSTQKNSLTADDISRILASS